MEFRCDRCNSLCPPKDGTYMITLIALMKGIPIVCARCAFKPDGSDYDSEGALLNLQTAFEANRPKQLYKAARKERNYLTEFYMKLQHSDYMIKQSEIDRTSEKILQLYHPAIVGHRYPVTTNGDGNCLYRAVSTVICGHQEQHVMLRLLCALELIENRQYYKSDNFLKGEDRIDKCSYSKLLHDVVKLNTEAGIEQFYVISAVLGKPIESYYPPQYPSYYTSEPLTRRVVGRTCFNTTPEVCIMWSQMSVPTSPDCLVPNHFVPLVSSSVVENSRSVSIREVDQSSGFIYPRVVLGLGKGSLQNASCGSSLYDMDDCIPSRSECPSESEVMSECSTRHTTGNVSPPSPDPMNSAPSSPISTQSETDVIREHSGSIRRFMPTKSVVELLTSNLPGLSEIPPGCKWDKYFLVDNSDNLERRSRNQPSSFSHLDAEKYGGSSGTTSHTWNLIGENGFFRVVYLKEGQFCKSKRINGKNVYVPLAPQPDMSDLVSIHRHYNCRKDDTQYKRRITWLGKGALASHLALVEYTWVPQ